MQVRTDLAEEAQALWRQSAGKTTQLEGVKARSWEEHGVGRHQVQILNEQGEKALGKPRGTYETLWVPGDGRPTPEAAEALGEAVRDLLDLRGGESVLVVGLGNRHLTADALGPLCTEKIIVTRHLKDTMPDVFRSFARVSAIAPGVLGLTGVETGEVVLGLCEKIRPDAIIAIDSLVSRKLSRLCRTIQLSDTGITPGGGIAPGRFPLDEQTLHTPVLALGIPTVVEARTLAADLCPNAPPEEELPPTSLIVTPKDIDALMVKSAKILGYAIDMALHTHLSVEDIESLLS